MTDIPELKNGRLPTTYKRGRQYARGEDDCVSDWKAERWIDAMTVGIDKEIDDPIVGRIPAGVPLSVDQSSRAIGLHLKKGRQLHRDPEVRSAIEARRTIWELGSAAMALGIRDDPSNAPKERIKAAEFLRGPRPATGVTVNVAQSNGQPMMAGYIVNLGTPMRDLKPEAEAKIIDATPPPDKYADGVSDVEKERREAQETRVRRE